MKFCLVIAFVAIAIASTSAAPGMRGNGASGATRDRDPANPNLDGNPGSGANAAASGNNAKVSTFSKKKNGVFQSTALAQNSVGSTSAQTSSDGTHSSSIALSVSQIGSAVANASSSKGSSSALAASSNGSRDGSSMAAVHG